MTLNNNYQVTAEAKVPTNNNELFSNHKETK